VSKLWGIGSVAARLPFILLLACSAGHEPAGPEVLTLRKDPTASGDGQSWSTGHILPQPLVVKVDNRGLAAAGVWVHWSPDPGSGYATADSSQTDSTGAARVSWRMPTVAGPALLVASVAGAIGSPQVFSATAYPNFPFRLEHVFGNGAVASAGSSLDLAVRVGDEFDNDFPGTTVYWTVVSGPAQLMAASSVTGSDGVATMTVTLGPGTGQVRVEASHPSVGVGSPVVMDITVQ